MLKDLAESVPQTRTVLVLSSDGLRMGHHGGTTESAERLAASCSGLQSLASAVGSELPQLAGKMQLVVIEMEGGFFSRCSPTTVWMPGSWANACGT
jgi:predicted regulator of Ras-like GTPase activity (Roadblock/LC7/MglB family)